MFFSSESAFFARRSLHRFHTGIHRVSLSDEGRSGALTFETDDGPIRYDLIRPRERTWPLYWRAAERDGQLPLREHS